MDGNPERAPEGTLLRHERQRSVAKHAVCLVQQHAVSFIAHIDASTGAELPRFAKYKFDAFFERGVFAAVSGASAARRLGSREGIDVVRLAVKELLREPSPQQRVDALHPLGQPGCGNAQ